MRGIAHATIQYPYYCTLTIHTLELLISRATDDIFTAELCTLSYGQVSKMSCPIVAIIQRFVLRSMPCTTQQPCILKSLPTPHTEYTQAYIYTVIALSSTNLY
jgi:hypothetical protein